MCIQNTKYVATCACIYKISTWYDTQQHIHMHVHAKAHTKMLTLLLSIIIHATPIAIHISLNYNSINGQTHKQAYAWWMYMSGYVKFCNIDPHSYSMHYVFDLHNLTINILMSSICKIYIKLLRVIEQSNDKEINSK